MSEEAGSARFRRIEALFLAAAELPSVQRADFLVRECGDDASLRHELETMLASDRDDALAAP